MVYDTQNYGVFTSFFVRYPKNYRTQDFGKWILERANLNTEHLMPVRQLYKYLRPAGGHYAIKL
jgi:hypothetical protein